MEKITLKEIAGYLPYDLKCDLGYMQVNVTLEDEMDSESICVRDLIENKHKILLYPLEMLTKPIVHNGVEIIPVVELQKLDCGHIDWITIEMYHWIKKYGHSHWLGRIPYVIIQKLYEWHFDIYGLIERGLATDKSTLNSK